MKRKKERGRGEPGGKNWFKRSNKTQRTPEGLGKVEGSGRDNEREEMIKGFKDMMGWKEELRQMKEEVREEGNRTIEKRMERIRKELEKGKRGNEGVKGLRGWKGG